MKLAKPGNAEWTRRGLLAALPLAPLAFAASEKGRTLPAEARRYADPATEFPVELMTDPKFSSILPYPYCRAIGKRGAFVLFSSDRGDGMQAFRLELKTGELKQLTEAAALNTSALTILPDDRGFCFLDGNKLKVSSFSGLRERDVYTVPDGWAPGEGLGVSIDGLYVTIVEKSGTRSRIRLIPVAKGGAQTLVEAEGDLRHPLPRPKRASVLYHRDGSLWLVNYDGQNNQKLCPAQPEAGAASWAPDGRTVVYLSAKEKQITMREYTPDSRQDRFIANTTQFISFASNADGSVFVGASRSVASPYVLVLLRSVKRELTVCEHKASNPAMVSPIWSPTSQRIYFQSDRHGKPAICSVVVDKFIEKTNLDDDDREEKPPPRPSVKKTQSTAGVSPSPR